MPQSNSYIQLLTHKGATMAPDKTIHDRNADLEHDNQHLYYVLGALTDAIDTLPELHRHQVIKILKEKAESAGDSADILRTLIEAMETCPKANQGQ